MDRHVLIVHRSSKAGKLLQAQKSNRRKGERRRRGVGKKRAKEFEKGQRCEQCHITITAHNMYRHIRLVHRESEAGKLLRMGVKERRRVGRKRSEDDVSATAGGEKKAGKRPQEEKKDCKKTAPARKKRPIQRRCKLCEYRGSDKMMMTHILNTHVTVPRKGINEP